MVSDVPSTTSRKPAEKSTFAHSRNQCGRYLSRVANEANGRRPWAIGGFRAVVFSLGGLMEKEAAEEIEKWRNEMRDTV